MKIRENQEPRESTIKNQENQESEQKSQIWMSDT